MISMLDSPEKVRDECADSSFKSLIVKTVAVLLCALFTQVPIAFLPVLRDLTGLSSALQADIKRCVFHHVLKVVLHDVLSPPADASPRVTLKRIYADHKARYQ